MIIKLQRIISCKKKKKENLINKSSFNEKIRTIARKEDIKTLATKAELKAEEDKIVKLGIHDLSHFLDINYFVFKICLFINLYLLR